MIKTTKVKNREVQTGQVVLLPGPDGDRLITGPVKVGRQYVSFDTDNGPTRIPRYGFVLVQEPPQEEG